MISVNDIDVFITAGGKSSRMGQDKGLMKIAGKPMILHLAEMLERNHYPFTVIANDQAYHKTGFKVTGDLIPGKGPMGALFTAIHYAERSFILLLGCDHPFLPETVITRLLASAEENIITVTHFGNSIHPLQTIYPVSLKNKVDECIRNDRLKMKSLILESPHRKVETDDLALTFPEGFINFNEPKDLLRWQTIR